MGTTQVGSLSEAIALAERWKAEGHYDWFRGQKRDCGPPRSTMARLSHSQEEYKRALIRLTKFTLWASRRPELASLTDDSLIAIAQHYQIATPFLDFTTEPVVAGFFAYDGEATSDAKQPGCIFCLNTSALPDSDYPAEGKPRLSRMHCLRLDPPELWRLHAQAGCFLEIPPHVCDVDDVVERILFPPWTGPPPLPREDVYPPQQSMLEIAIDQYLMIEAQQRSGKALLQMHSDHPEHVALLTFQGLPNGFDTDCFGPQGLPAHDSWLPDARPSWRSASPERWVPLSKAVVRDIVIPDPAGGAIHTPRSALNALGTSLSAMLGAEPALRRQPVRWRYLEFPCTDEVLRLFWNGCRRLPFTDQDLAAGLAATAIFAATIEENRGPRLDKHLVSTIAQALFASPAIEIRIGMADGSFTRGYIGEVGLSGAVRSDFHAHLSDRWKPQITQITQMLQVVTKPDLLFEFPAFAGVFVREFVPTQLGLRGGVAGRAQLYNPCYASSLGHA